jgi:acyl carrier protein
MDREELQKAVIRFVGELCKHHSVVATIEPDTDLFAKGILDSLRFTELMVYVQADLGIEVPDKKLVTRYFQTPRMIAENFGLGGT